MSHLTKREIEAAVGQRIYEYVDSDGVTFYSFTRLPNKVSLTRRFELQSRLGVHLTNFITTLRRLGMESGLEDEDAG